MKIKNKMKNNSNLRVSYLVLFIIVLSFFGVASLKDNLIKIAQAATSYTSTGGWLWGGSDNGASVNTGIGWISMNYSNSGAGGSISYAASLPSDNSAVSGYGWSENVGWIDFEPQNHCGSAYSAASCTPPSGSAGVYRSSNSLTGWARIVSIAQASASGNSGGWSGWISMNSSTSGSSVSYGVDLTKMDGTGTNSTYAWSDEMGWIDFGRASVPTLIVCTGSTIDIESPYQLYAYYADNLNITCSSHSGATDVTSSATWSISPSGGALSLTSTKGQVQATLPEGTFTVTASYTNSSSISVSGTATITVDCQADCSCEESDCTKNPANVCSGETYTDTWKCSETCSGTKKCGSATWKEINP